MRQESKFLPKPCGQGVDVSIVFASLNAGKTKEITSAFSEVSIPLVSMRDYEVASPAETGLSFLENALIKARHVAQQLVCPVLADDSGLVVPALGGKPGVTSARYAGETATDQQNIYKLLETMSDVKDRFAYFICVLVFLRSADDPVPVVTQGVWEGTIAHDSVGSQGFGYDPVFRGVGHQCSAAELSVAEKSSMSHRGKAIRKMLVEIQSIIREGEICQTK